MKYKRIIVAVNKCEPPDLALKEAIELTQDLDATLRVIYVIDEDIVKLSGKIDLNLDEAFRAEAQEFMQKLQDYIKNENIKFDINFLINHGRLAETIVKETRAWKADLLIIGTHGCLVRHSFLGSVAAKILRIATLPVLLVGGKVD